MREFTKEERNRLAILESKATDLYYKHRRICEQIESLLSDENSENIEDVIFQPGDGICVVCVAEDFTSDTLVPNNIPLARYIQGDRV